MLHGGLSPRVRGNPARNNPIKAYPGPIPAGAGEPAKIGTSAAWPRAYPRGCGGTLTLSFDDRVVTGLSPRVRGNQTRNIAEKFHGGPIPAGAGEPMTEPGDAVMIGAYPRGCGGTVSRRSIACRSSGLSPRVRGNHKGQFCFQRRGGPIPAGAGEPAQLDRLIQPDRAYPRGCGGTVSEYSAKPSPSGLSPRVRGNPKQAVHGSEKDGPIPAGAGEPQFYNNVG